MGVSHVDREKGDLSGAHSSRQLDKRRKLPEVSLLNGDSHTDGDARSRGRLDSGTDFVERVQSPNGCIGLAVGSIQRHCDCVKEPRHAPRMLCKGKARGEQPQLQTVFLQ